MPDNINLTPLVLATWFCDDGWIGKSCGKRIKIKLSTHGFSKESVYKMAQRLTNLFKATFTIGCDNGKYFILSADKGAKAFAEYIAPVMPLSMKRKFKWITT